MRKGLPGVSAALTLLAAPTINFDTPGAVVPIFVLAQGIFAALGSQWIR